MLNVFSPQPFYKLKFFAYLGLKFAQMGLGLKCVQIGLGPKSALMGLGPKETFFVCLRINPILGSGLMEKDFL